MNDPNMSPTEAVDAARKAQTFSESLSAMKESNESEAQRIVAAETKSKPKTLADACLEMKDENLVEAHRLIPDRDAGTTAK